MQIDEAYYLILDLEATCARKNRTIPRDEQETIEMGAVMVNEQSLQMEGEFQCFIRPVIHPQLTSYCTRLTSITQADVDGGLPFSVALTQLWHWADGFGSYRLCAWGNFDQQQLQRDCRRYGLAYPLGDAYLNLKPAFAASQGTRQMGLMSSLKYLGLTAEGQAHRGIDDARNTARLVVTVRQRMSC